MTSVLLTVMLVIDVAFENSKTNIGFFSDENLLVKHQFIVK